MDSVGGCKSKAGSTALAVLCNKSGKHYIYEVESVIGRSPSAFLCVTNPHISRKHCVIVKSEDNKFTICDMSNSGTFVNDKRLVKNNPQELNHLDRIKLADLEPYSYVFLINTKHLGIKSPPRPKNCSALAEKMNDLNETQSLEKDNMNRELDLLQREMGSMKEKFSETLKAREEEMNKERLKISMDSASMKEQADKMERILKERVDENKRIEEEYKSKFAEVSHKARDLQVAKDEMEKRHQLEREELEKKCKAEIEELKKKLDQSETKNQHFEELQARLEETKSILLESELEQQRLFEAKVEVETKLESKILDLKNERENKEEQVKELEQKLKEKQDTEERIKKEMEGLEDDMMCSICAELYIEPSALNCGHMFCKLCITEWSKKKKICPMCRAKISTTIRIFNMDSVIQRNVSLMSEEVRTRREALIAERKRSKTPQKKKSAKKRRRETYEVIVNDVARGGGIHNPAVRVQSRASPQADFPALRIQPTVTPRPAVSLDRLLSDNSTSSTNLESQGDDPFAVGWTRPHGPPSSRLVGRNSPVTVAAVDLTNVTPPPRSRARTHTVTSANANTTIDLTNF